MKTIIAGSRDFNDKDLLEASLFSLPWHIDTVVSGRAQGADKLGELYAYEYNKDIKLFPANWDLHGKSAGYLRNKQMAEYADALVAFWDCKSKGTKHMIDLAVDHGLYVKVVKYE